MAQDRPPFNDVRVRRAIAMAIDRQKQVETVFEGHGILGWGVPYIYYQDTAPTAAQFGPWWQYRPAEAKKLLAEAGQPNGFSTTLFYYEYFPQMTSQVQLVPSRATRWASTSGPTSTCTPSPRRTSSASTTPKSTS